MKESQQPMYRVRLTADYQFYDHQKTQLWRSWRAGVIVTDRDDIRLLEAHGAPIVEERIEA